MLLPRFAALHIVGVTILSAATVCAQTPATGSGQGFPHRPVRIITGEPGGGLDFATRLIAQGIAAPLGQTIVVDNRGGGTVLVDMLVRAPADGHTLLLHASNIWLAPLLREHVQYDPLRDLLPVTLTSMAPNILVAHPALPANSVKDLIGIAKAKPGTLNYSSGSTGSTSHLAAELFKFMAGVNLVRIPYKGTGPALTSLMAGEVQVMFSSAGGVTPHIKSGRLKALAVSSAQPSALFPDLPTVAASGLPGYESVSVAAIFAPAKTPAVVINRLNREVVAYLRTPEASQRFLSSGVEIVASSPAQLSATIKSDIARLGKVIKEAGIREE